MSSRAEAYRFTDNKTPLSASELNARFFDVDRRLAVLERIEQRLIEEVDKFPDVGLQRIAATLAPVIAEASTLINDARTLIDTAEDIADNSTVDAKTSWSDETSLTYDAFDRVSTVTENINGATKTTTLGYDEDGRVSTVQTDWDGVRRVETLSYNPDGTIAQVAVTEEAL